MNNILLIRNGVNSRGECKYIAGYPDELGFSIDRVINSEQELDIYMEEKGISVITISSRNVEDLLQSNRIILQSIRG